MQKQKKIHISRKKPDKIVIKRSRKKRLRDRIMTFWRSNKRKVILGGTILGFGLCLLIMSFLRNGDSGAEVSADELLDVIPVSATKFDYPDLLPPGVDLSTYRDTPYQRVIVKDIPLRDYFMAQGFEEGISREIAFQARYEGLHQFDQYRSMYIFTTEKQSKGNHSDFFIYQMQMSPDSFAVITLQPEVRVRIKQLPIMTEVRKVSGIVKSPLFWNSFLENGGDYRLIPEIQKALKWKVNFYYAHPNDRYKLIYEEKWYKEEIVGIGNLLAVYYHDHDQDREHYAFHFDDGRQSAFFDQDGNAMKLRFLKSPVEYNIINSPYNLNRIHPIKKEKIPHLGTDYFARLNDPVFAVGDGEVIIAGTTSGNGNYVKIKHDDEDRYKSQYLHLNEFAEGIRRGTQVKQGDVIGYAGKTGLATGVHVCFRFWIGNQQVDHTREEVFQGPSDIRSVGHLTEFAEQRDRLQQLLKNM